MTTQIVLAALLGVQGVLLGGAKVLRLPAMRERAEHVGFTAEDYRRIGALELLAVAGIAVGVAVPVLGVLAACGLIVLLAGAVVAHVRAGDGPAELAPALVVAALAAGYVLASQ